jgi:hypothetical protein
MLARQSIQNRLKHVAQVTEPWNETGSGLSNERLRILLKKTFLCNYCYEGEVTTPGSYWTINFKIL